MNWWYENEEEKMELYKNEDLCIECKNDFFSKPYDHRDPTPGTIGYCIKCDNFLIKEKKMEFDRDRVYGAVNADELRAGDKVIVGDSLRFLRQEVEGDGYIETLKEVLDESHLQRFKAKDGVEWGLAYLVERQENCTTCRGEDYCKKKYHIENGEQLICHDYAPKENCTNCNKYYTCKKYTYETPRVASMMRCTEYEPKTETEKPKQKEIDMDNWNYLNYFGCSLPEKQEMGVSDRVVVAVTGYNTVDIGYYDYELEAWFVDGNRYPVPVYAWMEVKPPREEE